MASHRWLGISQSISLEHQPLGKCGASRRGQGARKETHGLRARRVLMGGCLGWAGVRAVSPGGPSRQRHVAPRDPGKEHPGLRKELEQTSEQEEACKVPPLSQPWRGKLFLLKLFETYCKTTPKIKTLFIILPLLRQ